MINEHYVDLPNGEKMFYTVSGEGETNALAIHGNYGSWKSLEDLHYHMPKGCKLYIPDLRGFGRTSYNHPYFSIKELSDDLILFCKEVGIKKAVVIGHSLGGAVAMQFAIDAQDITTKLFLIAPSSVYGYPIFKEDGKGGYLPYKSRYDLLNMDAIKLVNTALENNDFNTYLAVLGAMSDGMNKKEGQMEEFIREALLQRDLIAADWALMVWNITDKPSLYSAGNNQYKEIKCPTCLLTADEDKFVFPFMNDTNAFYLGQNPNFKHIKYVKCGHMIMNDQPDKFYADLHEFIKE